jgi:hypothetical protein
MEVHHHAHHDGKKNWKSYLREFLMLFFAVFCGFLAEWRLEKMIEHHREEEYMHSIVDDIDADIKQTNALITDMDKRILNIDSLLTSLGKSEIKTQSNDAYKLWLKTIGFPDFVQNDRTIQQLKSSGSLRIIRNGAVSDKIMEYDQAVRLLDVTQTNMNTIASDNTLFSQIFNINELNKKNGAIVELTDSGKSKLNEAYGNRFFWRFNLLGLRSRFVNLNTKGKEVSAFIKKEYHIK